LLLLSVWCESCVQREAAAGSSAPTQQPLISRRAARAIGWRPPRIRAFARGGWEEHANTKRTHTPPGQRNATTAVDPWLRLRGRQRRQRSASMKVACGQPRQRKGAHQHSPPCAQSAVSRASASRRACCAALRGHRRGRGANVELVSRNGAAQRVPQRLQSVVVVEQERGAPSIVHARERSPLKGGRGAGETSARPFQLPRAATRGP
jgi:hypothetical protein